MIWWDKTRGTGAASKMAGFYVKILFCTLALGKFSIFLNARRWHLIVKKYLIFACF